jgi:hypothetical protein
MAEKLDIDPHIVEAVLNHVGGHKRGVAGVYNKATYERRKRDALDRWGTYVEAALGRHETDGGASKGQGATLGIEVVANTPERSPRCAIAMPPLSDTGGRSGPRQRE